VKLRGGVLGCVQAARLLQIWLEGGGKGTHCANRQLWHLGDPWGALSRPACHQQIANGFGSSIRWLAQSMLWRVCLSNLVFGNGQHQSQRAATSYNMFLIDCSASLCSAGLIQAQKRLRGWIQWPQAGEPRANR
jgi:hypothetical protein